MLKVAEINSFLCYRSYLDATDVLPEDKRWPFFKSAMLYALDGVEPVFTEDIEIAMFKLMKANLDSCGKRYIANVENGKKGGRPTGKTGEKKPNKKPTETQGLNPQKPKVKTHENLNKDKDDNKDYNPYPTDEGALSAPPPSGTGSGERFQMSGKFYEYYIAENGERRVRQVE